MNIPDIYRAVSVTPPNDPDLRRYIRDGLAVTYDLSCTVPCKECRARPDIFRACPKCGSIQPARTIRRRRARRMVCISLWPSTL